MTSEEKKYSKKFINQLLFIRAFFFCINKNILTDLTGFCRNTSTKLPRPSAIRLPRTANNLSSISIFWLRYGHGWTLSILDLHLRCVMRSYALSLVCLTSRSVKMTWYTRLSLRMTRHPMRHLNHLGQMGKTDGFYCTASLIMSPAVSGTSTHCEFLSPT